MDVVAVSGTDFAYPSQTEYLSRGKGFFKEKPEKAEGTVKRWKQDHETQIPHFDQEIIDSLKDIII